MLQFDRFITSHCLLLCDISGPLVQLLWKPTPSPTCSGFTAHCLQINCSFYTEWRTACSISIQVCLYEWKIHSFFGGFEAMETFPKCHRWCLTLVDCRELIWYMKLKCICCHKTNLLNCFVSLICLRISIEARQYFHTEASKLTSPNRLYYFRCTCWTSFLVV